MLVLDISYVIDHISLPHLVIVSVVGFTYFWRKKESLSTTGRNTL